MDKMKFKKMIGEIKKDIVLYNLFQLVDGVEYGDYTMNMTNERGVIVYEFKDDKGFAFNTVGTQDFLKMSSDHIEKMFNSTIYYDYIQNMED